MKLGNETEITADLTIASQNTCPCCGSTDYHTVATYNSDGVVTGRANSCIQCRDTLCERCNQV